MSIICVTYTSKRLATHTSKFVCEKYAAAKISSNTTPSPPSLHPPLLSRLYLLRPTAKLPDAGFVKMVLPVS